jgi:hypothetical protein
MFGTYVRVGVAAFERDSMLAGSPDAQMVYFNQPAGTFSFQPADFDGTPPPAGTPCFFGYLNSSSQNFEVYEFDVNWSSPSSSTFSLVSNLDVAAYNSNMNGIPQPGTGTRLDDLAQMLMYRLQYRNFGSYEVMVANHTVNVGSGRAGIRWYELRKEDAGWYVYQQGTYAPDDGQYRWMGSIAMNANGDIAIGYSLASSTAYPSVYYAGRRTNATLGEMNLPEVKIIGGTGSQSGIDRWGDYSCLSVDPSDDTTFWFTTEYNRNGWRTRIASFDFGPIMAPEVFAGNDSTICEHSPFQADASAAYQQSVLWHSTGDGSFVDPTVVKATYLRGQGDLAAGEFTLWLDAFGYAEGQQVSDTVEVTLSRAARANAGPDTTICVNETLMLAGSAMYQDSILWKTDGDGTFDDVKILNATYTPGPEDKNKGYAWLRLLAYDSLPCSNLVTDRIKITIDQCTGITEIDQDGPALTVIPNPALSRLTFELTGFELNRDVVLTLTNSSGNEVFRMKVGDFAGVYSNILDVSRFPRGIYYLKASTLQNQVINKIILQ